MTDMKLRPAARDELLEALSFALRFNGRKRTHRADEFMAHITAEHLAKHLEGSGFVVTKRPPRLGHGAKRAPHIAP